MSCAPISYPVLPFPLSLLPRSMLPVPAPIFSFFSFLHLLSTPAFFFLMLPYVLLSGLLKYFFFGTKEENKLAKESMQEWNEKMLENINQKAGLAPQRNRIVSLSPLALAAEQKIQQQLSLKAFRSVRIPSLDSAAQIHIVLGGSFNRSDSSPPSSSSRPTLVFLHGWPDNWSTFSPQLLFFLEKGYDVAAVELKGFGLSGTAQHVAEYGAKALNQDLGCALRYIQQLKKTNSEKQASSSSSSSSAAPANDEFILIGHDFGGIVLWNFAFEQEAIRSEAKRVDKRSAEGEEADPSRQLFPIVRYVILNAPHPSFYSSYTLLHDWTQLLRSWYVFFFMLPFFIPEAHMFFYPRRFVSYTKKPHQYTHEEREYAVGQCSCPEKCKGMINFYRAMVLDTLLFRSIPAMPVSVPLLQLWGQHDEVLAFGLAKQLPRKWTPHPQSGTVGLEANHWPTKEKPEEVCKEILKFIQQ